MWRSVRVLGNRAVLRRRPRGFSLLETAISSLLVGVVLVSSMNVLGQSLITQRERALTATGTFLAEGLLSEVLQQSYMEPGLTSSTIRREEGELSDNRANYDDVDDYHNYTESPPKYKNGSTMPGFSGWSRSVNVVWVDHTNLATTRNFETAVKRVTVQTVYNGQPVATAIGFRGNAP